MPDRGRNPRRPIVQAIERLVRPFLLNGKVAAWSHRAGLQGKLSITRYDICASTPLPKPLTIAFASDLHAGPTTHGGLFDQLGEQMRLLQPDVVLLGGDYVAFDARYAQQLGAMLRAFTPPLGVYGVIGNHDIRNGRESIEAVLRAAGVQVLVNRNVALPAPFDMVSICGIDDPWTGEADAISTFAHAGPVKLFLTHSPDGLVYLQQETFDVAFAGHTHGGQVAHRSGAPVVQPVGPLSRQYCYGAYTVPGRGELIVSRGVGCTLLPLRLNADPELVICTLR